MRKLNLFHIVIPIILLFFCFNIVSFASQKKLPDNFINMSAEQRIQWLDQNIPQKTEYATRINSSRSTESPKKMLTLMKLKLQLLEYL